MADNLGPMAWLFLPENVQVQYLQKIALRAENPSGRGTGINSRAWLPENVQVQYLQKIALRAENPSGHKHNLIALRI